ncbi:MAG: hypothetical protein AB7W28_07650 [Armatimonadota bacterium]
MPLGDTDQVPLGDTEWMCRAFVNLKATLMSEIIATSGEYVSEDYVRSSLLRGLMIAAPSLAASVSAEYPAPWGNSSCFCGATPGGRPVAHDIGVESNCGELRMACEVKWIVTNRAADLKKDIWKLSLTRGVASSAQVTKIYMAIAGHRKAIHDTLEGLRRTGLDLRWSSQGRGGPVPRSRQLQLGRALKKHTSVREGLCQVLSWGKWHLRPPRKSGRP